MIALPPRCVLTTLTALRGWGALRADVAYAKPETMFTAINWSRFLVEATLTTEASSGDHRVGPADANPHAARSFSACVANTIVAFVQKMPVMYVHQL